MKCVRGIESQMNENQQLLIRHHLPHSIILATDFAYMSPSIVIVKGIDPEGNVTQAFSHVNAMQLELKIVTPKQEDTKERRPIGFTVIPKK